MPKWIFLQQSIFNEHMYPKPLEIICYHCQQSIEKLLKGLLISKNVTIKRLMTSVFWQNCFRNMKL
ncbi:hypothetical protein RUMHYD_03392 [Blautia hydrogenotrophica DSM 10507]|uniref:HEPN domain-containing protein n=1 Tax=Blautia hydrogenotrophica (strain DSM 10507 / JCM 14656 / S5a33) TaxID=476272 RepID=C0CR79_BLAHS|nr:hypothetical protein RUMHYD_03392 [Blautia hydrogenotrophica DSM 10507]MCT6797623.1 HEPN domain-containing protein [Blautia hydrogenotrophica]